MLEVHHPDHDGEDVSVIDNDITPSSAKSTGNNELSPKLYPASYLYKIFILGTLCGALLAVVICFAFSTLNSHDTAATTPSPSASAGESGSRGPGNPVAGDPSTSIRQPSSLARRIDGDKLAMGKVDAPIVMIEYADYRCPFCSLFATDRFPKIVADYIDTGLVRFEFRDMPVFGEESFQTAIAGRAAAEQGKFFEFQHVIAENGVAAGGHPSLPRERLIDFAKKAGVSDIERFTADLDNPDLKAAVQSDYDEGRSLGASSVPAFIIGNTPMLGAQEYDTFVQVIDRELDAAGVKR